MDSGLANGAAQSGLQHPFVVPAYSLEQQQQQQQQQQRWEAGLNAQQLTTSLPSTKPHQLPSVGAPTSNGFPGIPAVLPPRHTASSQPAAATAAAPAAPAAYATSLSCLQMPHTQLPLPSFPNGPQVAASRPADPLPTEPPQPPQPSRRAAAAAARATVVAAAAEEEASSTDSGDFTGRKPARKKKQVSMSYTCAGQACLPLDQSTGCRGAIAAPTQASYHAHERAGDGCQGPCGTNQPDMWQSTWGQRPHLRLFALLCGVCLVLSAQAQPPSCLFFPPFCRCCS